MGTEFKGNMSNCTIITGGSVTINNGVAKEEKVYDYCNEYTESVEPEECAEPTEDAGEIIAALTPLFYGVKADAIQFLQMVREMKPTQITDLVNQWVAQKKIAQHNCHRDLWKVLNDNDIYMRSESNWNAQVK